jgi:site-specific DNA-methyltransferase (adenine-specific)
MPSTAGDVLSGRARWSVEAADALTFLKGLGDGAADLTVFSPPYEGQRTYGIGFALRGQDWVDWLRSIVAEACRATAGLVCVNASGPVEDFRYSPAVEWLVADITRLDGLVCGPAPYAWTKNGMFGSGGEHYHRRDWEPVYCFARPENLPPKWSDNTAFGKPCVYESFGGEASNRGKDGSRRNQDRPTGRLASGRDGRLVRQKSTKPEIANPGTVIRAVVGGGNLGHELAHENEAPYPVALAERFVCWYCPPGGVVCDPFSGSGTTCHAAIVHGRRFVGCDVRESQVKLIRRRIPTVTPSLLASLEGAGRPHPGGGA